MKMVGLREIRKKKGYTQLKVAMDLSISREALSYYENGKEAPIFRCFCCFHSTLTYLSTTLSQAKTLRRNTACTNKRRGFSLTNR